MYVQVRLLRNFKQPLFYQIPAEWDKKVIIGSFIKVPLKNRLCIALVEHIQPEKPNLTFTIKYALSFEQAPCDPHYFSFIKKLAYLYQTDYLIFIERIKEFLQKKNTAEQNVLTEQQLNSVQLTPEQQQVVDSINEALNEKKYKPMLLHGVTGSGKTEIYKKAIERALEQQKTSILLLPEVTLALQFEQIFKNYFNSRRVIGFHCATSPKTKRDLWNFLINNEPIIIIGVHLPILLPIANLGIIIVDEEHETGYQEKKHPKINSKEAALLRAQHYCIPILLGSATPSISSLYNQATKNWTFFQLKNRFVGTFPTIQQICLIDQKKRPHFWISNELYRAIKAQLERKEQTIIFLNRRGYSFFIQCKQCSFIVTCLQCSVSLTLHEGNILTCHYCNYTIPCPTCCPQCKKDNNHFLKKGIGTQQLVLLIQQLFPTARIARADLDTTTKKNQWKKTIQDFDQGNLDILIGTQTITKGYHFPNVTLVGIIWADLNLHFPLYNAAETTLQQLIQVAGRAGRSNKASTVIIQTISNHPIFSYLNELDYLDFYHAELENRRMVQYPPLMRLAQIELKNIDESRVEHDAQSIGTMLQSEINRQNLSIKLLGPVKPPVHKVSNWHIRQLYIKGANVQAMLELYKIIDYTYFKSAIYFTLNPLT